MRYFIYGYKYWGESINGCFKSIHHLQTLESNMYEESQIWIQNYLGFIVLNLLKVGTVKSQVLTRVTN